MSFVVLGSAVEEWILHWILNHLLLVSCREKHELCSVGLILNDQLQRSAGFMKLVK